MIFLRQTLIVATIMGTLLAAAAFAALELLLPYA